MNQRTCPVCREPFTPANHNQRFCPPTDEARASAKGQPRSRCARAYQRAQQRGTLDELLATPWSPPAPYDCARCGAHCVPGDNVAAHASKFCGQACKKNWHREHVELPREKAKRKRARAKRRLTPTDGQPRLWIEGRCRGCGRRFTAGRAASHAAHYCSRTCQRRQERARRRAQKRDAFVEEVWRSVLYERDRWTCQLCGDPVDPAAEYPDPMMASVDHIVPLSKGGEHSYKNTQLAHFLCNALKSDREQEPAPFAA